MQPAPNGPVAIAAVRDLDGLLVLLIPARLPGVRSKWPHTRPDTIADTVTIRPLPENSGKLCWRPFWGFPTFCWQVTLRSKALLPSRAGRWP
jgi:hypothetical protein